MRKFCCLIVIGVLFLPVFAAGCMKPELLRASSGSEVGGNTGGNMAQGGYAAETGGEIFIARVDEETKSVSLSIVPQTGEIQEILIPADGHYAIKDISSVQNPCLNISSSDVYLVSGGHIVKYNTIAKKSEDVLTLITDDYFQDETGAGIEASADNLPYVHWMYIYGDRVFFTVTGCVYYDSENDRPADDGRSDDGRDVKSALYTMKTDGTGVKYLTALTWEEASGSCFPDGNFLYYASGMRFVALDASGVGEDGEANPANRFDYVTGGYGYTFVDDRENGTKELWRRDIMLPAGHDIRIALDFTMAAASVNVIGGYMFFIEGNNQLCRMNLETGVLERLFKLSAETAADTRIYTAGEDLLLFAMSKGTVARRANNGGKKAVYTPGQ